MSTRKTDGEDNARLGRIAQKQLDLALEYSRLTVTSPRPDLNGLDFMLEEIDNIGLAKPGLDRSPEHRKLDLQLKGTAKTTPKVKVSISRLNALVKSPRPSVIAVMHFRVSDIGEPSVLSFYMVHLLDDRLAAALKALRRNGLASKSAMNDAFFSLTARPSERVALEGPALYAAFAKVCGPSMSEYAREKTHQLSTLGYPVEGRHRFVGKISAPVGDVVDGLLGLKPFVLESIEHWETRFDLPEKLGTGSGTVSVTAPPTINGHFIVQSGKARVQVDAEMKRLPFEVPANHDKRVIQTAGLEIVVAGNTWSMRGLDPVPDLPASRWIEEMRCAEIIFGGNARLSFEASNGEWLSWSATRARSAESIAEVVARRELFQCIAHLERVAGVAGDNVDPVVIIEQQHNIRLLSGIAKAEFPLRLEWEMDFEGEREAETAILAFKVPINRKLLAFAFEMHLWSDAERWVGKSTAFLDASALPDGSIEAFEQFHDRLKRLTGIDTAITLLPADENQVISLGGKFGGASDDLELRFYRPDSGEAETTVAGAA